MNRILDILGKLKHWDLVDKVGESQYYLASKNKSKLVSCIVAPHSGNDYKWMVRIANWKGFDRWCMAEVQEYFGTFEGVVDFLSMIDVEKELKSNND